MISEIGLQLLSPPSGRVLLCGPRRPGHQGENPLQQAGRHLGETGSATDQSTSSISFTLNSLVIRQLINH
jgi:hypothetical protein